MAVVTDAYTAPTSWQDMRVDYAGNGDSADWVYGIREAVMERLAVILDGQAPTSSLEAKAAQLTAIDGRENVELYAFAQLVESILDEMLTPLDRFGTIANTRNPLRERGYFVNPAHPLKRVEFVSVATGEPAVTVIPDYLDISTVTAVSGANYRAALANVGRCSLPGEFMPFFLAAKKALNQLTAVRAKTSHVVGGSGATTDQHDGYAAVIAEMSDQYDADMANEPDPSMLTEGYSPATLDNFARVVNTGATPAVYQGHFRWYHVWVHHVASKFPPIKARLIRGVWAEPYTAQYHTHYDYTWTSSPYTPDVSYVGEVSGPGHLLPVGASQFTPKFPFGGPTWPSAPGSAQLNMSGYTLHMSWFADFNLSGGFRFREV